MFCSVANETCLNGGPCVANLCICTSSCVTGSQCENYLNLLGLPLPSTLLYETLIGSIVYTIVISVLSLIGLMSNLFALITLFRERIRITNRGLYLIILSFCNIFLMILLSTDLISIQHSASKSFRYWGCFPSAYILNILVYLFNYLSLATIVERVLIECYNFKLVGSRKRACFVSLILLIGVALSNIPEVLVRDLVPDRKHGWICIYKPNEGSVMNQLQYYTSLFNVVFPFFAHFISIILILTSIARRKIFISSDETDRKNFIQMWWRQFYIHRDHLLPPLSILICTLPHTIIHYILLTKCSATDLTLVRVHIVLLLFRHLPAVFTFLIYIYPNKIYWKEFQQIFIYRLFSTSKSFGTSLIHVYEHRLGQW